MDLEGRLLPSFAHLPVVTPKDFQPPEVRRAQMAPLFRRACAERVLPEGHAIENLIVAGPPDSSPLILRQYRPAARTRGAAILYFHGGGFTVGSLDAAQATCIALAETVGCIVYSVDYRLAPEHPYPAALEDGYAALLALADRAEVDGFDALRIAVAGSSAGGAIAASVAIAARDRYGPKPCYQALSCPMLDDRLETLSARTFVAVPVYSRFQAQASWAAYLNGKDMPAAAPARVARVDGLPPACIIAAELDPLRDEAIEYARRLMASNIPAGLHMFSGAPHGFDVVAPDAPASRLAFNILCAGLSDAFDRPFHSLHGVIDESRAIS